MIVAGARVLDPAEPVDRPPVRDLEIVDGVIVGLHEPLPNRDFTDPDVLDARGLLAVPGFVNAHHHSYDVLAKGLLEDMPFDVWALHSQPGYFGPRSQAEVRARTLLSGLDCLRSGITTVQDFCTVVPMDEETLDVVVDAYAELGIRVVFSAAVRDVAELDIAGWLPPVADEFALLTGGSTIPAAEQLAFVAAQLDRRPADGMRGWALSPSGPQRCSDELLEGIAALSADRGLPVFTHVLETPPQLLRSRQLYGSMVRHLDDLGLLSERTNLVHAVWADQDELELAAATGARLVHNPVSNMKLRSGIAPVAAALAAGVEVALGCDNASCGDAQNMFQAMKGMCLLAGLVDPGPSGVVAATALRSATSVGARAVGRPDLGTLQPGAPADVVLLDLADVAYQPLNSAVRQLVYAESGRGVRTVLVGGRPVLRDGVVTTIDEPALFAEVAELAEGFRRDHADVAARAAAATGPLLTALDAVVTELA